MKCVVDSNILQTHELRQFLSRSKTNSAVFPDYAFMEAVKDDTLASVFKSLAVLAEYPEQVIVLKTTMAVCGLHGGSRGLQRRLVDVPRTREFAVFCRALGNARQGDPTMQGELLRLGREATTHLESVRSDAIAFSKIGEETSKMFTREEQHLLRTGRRVSPEVLRKIVLACVWQSEVLFVNHPAVKRLPTQTELPNTYIFRSSLSHLLLVLKWATDGGTSTNPAKVRNSMVDAHFAAYSTYFDTLLSKDATAVLVAGQARTILAQLQQPGLRRG